MPRENRSGVKYLINCKYPFYRLLTASYRLSVCSIDQQSYIQMFGKRPPFLVKIGRCGIKMEDEGLELLHLQLLFSKEWKSDLSFSISETRGG